MKQKPSTIDDVARLAKVSTATVSRALRGHSNVTSATRRRVEEAATLLDYQANPAASWLASGRTNTVAMVVPVLDSWYFSSVMAGAEEVLSDNGFELAMFVTGDPDARRRLMTSPMLARVEGAILVNVALGSREIELLVTSGTPALSIGLELGDIPSLIVDDVDIGLMATNHLIELGHRDIGLLSGSTDDRLGFAVPDRRREGYRRALSLESIERRPELEVDGLFSIRGGFQATAALLDLDNPPSAIFAMSDEMAFGALKAVRDRGLRVPDDMSLVGVDDHPLAWVEDLTTVEQQVGQHGALAAQAILDQINGAKGEARVEAGTSLVLRNSTARHQ